VKLLIAVTAVTFAASLLGAVLADAFLVARVPILGDFASLQYSHNAGVAFGMKLPGGVQEVAILIALIVVVIVAVREARRLPASRFPLTAFGLILGGGIANVVDRVRDGYVTDFFQVGTFPIFNIADSCITIGVIILLLEAVIQRKRDSKV